MKIGVPKEIKPAEGRVALVPAAAAELVDRGHSVFLQTGAGEASGYPDLDYQTAGVEILPDATSIYAGADLIIKVKEPVAAEYGLMRPEHIIFSYLHLAANPELTQALCGKGLTAIGFETVEDRGNLPLLAPMSEIAGKLAVQIGTTLLHSPQGGRGIMLGGMPSAERGRVVVLGAGHAGGASAALAAAMGSQVTVFARSRGSHTRMHALGPNVTALPPYRKLLAQAVSDADLLIGAVLITGARAPQLVSADMVKQMKRGSVIVDISVDQGGCIATTRPTDYTQPTYVQDEVIHFAVTNIPGAVPRTASQALSAVLLPYIQRLVDQGLDDPVIQTGINVRGGKVVHPAIASTHN